MNERIKELAEQSGFDISNKTTLYLVNGFAELLIQECANLAGDATEDDSEQRSPYYVITDHFGL